jgi:hypothetical protein
MKTKAKLSLHEAMVVALINLDNETFQATYEKIADYIKKHELFQESKIPLCKQVRLRATLSNKKYKYLFKEMDDNTIKLHLRAASSLK